jgi:opacity protein-like surface antigen
MKRGILAIVIVLLCIVLVIPSQADITGWLGNLSSDDLFIDGTMVWGGAVGFSFMKYFGAEFVVDYARNSELPFNLEEFEDLLGVDIIADMLFLSGNVFVQYPMDGFTPYFTMGYGGFGIRVSNDLYEDIEDILGGSTLYTYGFGLKVDVAPFIGVRGEWRSYRLNISGEDIESVLVTVENPTFSRLAGGVSITF